MKEVFIEPVIHATVDQLPSKRTVTKTKKHKKGKASKMILKLVDMSNSMSLTNEAENSSLYLPDHLPQNPHEKK